MYYVAHRLFALHDRALGALVARELASRVGEDQVFLPFCDTDEEALVSECKGRTLFELDTERLRSLRGMIAIVHGPSVDDGVCMEIGYAASVGAPVVIVTTDFQTYGHGQQDAELHFPDPLLEALATHVVRSSKLESKRRRSDRSRFHAFLVQNLDPLRNAAQTAAERLISCSTAPTGQATTEVDLTSAFVEPSPYVLDQAESLMNQVSASGMATFLAKRLTSVAETGADLVLTAREDWSNLQRTGVLVVDINGPETPLGAALLIGASVADGRRVLGIYNQRSQTFAPGREPNSRNLMIQYSIDEWCRDIEEVGEALVRWAS